MKKTILFQLSIFLFFTIFLALCDYCIAEESAESNEKTTNPKNHLMDIHLGANFGIDPENKSMFKVIDDTYYAKILFRYPQIEINNHKSSNKKKMVSSITEYKILNIIKIKKQKFDKNVEEQLPFYFDFSVIFNSADYNNVRNNFITIRDTKDTIVRRVISDWHSDNIEAEFGYYCCPIKNMWFFISLSNKIMEISTANRFTFTDTTTNSIDSLFTLKRNFRDYHHVINLGTRFSNYTAESSLQMDFMFFLGWSTLKGEQETGKGYIYGYRYRAQCSNTGIFGFSIGVDISMTYEKRGLRPSLTNTFEDELIDVNNLDYSLFVSKYIPIQELLKLISSGK